MITVKELIILINYVDKSYSRIFKSNNELSASDIINKYKI